MKPPEGARPYVGRFAPSPTGSLHMGSLVAAVGSFLDARRNGGRWLLRMEDLDAARAVPGSSDEILRTLELFGLEWDGDVEFQSRQTERYAAALESLHSRGLTFECSCSRRELANSAETGYPGTCRKGPTRAGPTAIRFRIDATDSAGFEDRLQGACRFDLRALGDVIVRRRDATFAYQLAVVVDDARQGVTDVVRGADLLQSTLWQMALQRALALPEVRYGHLPLVIEAKRGKLSKSRGSIRLDTRLTNPQLVAALRLLQHPPPPELETETPRKLLAWATNNWRPERLRGLLQVITPAS
jgi:glutamyl-Q tRNA(Asp) synthetase